MYSHMLVLALCIIDVLATPAQDGKWDPYKFGNTGKYIPLNEGQYMHIYNPYIHVENPYVHDDRPYVPPPPPPPRIVLVKSQAETLLPFYKPGYYQDNDIKIVKQTHHYDEDKYNYDFETENLIRAGEKAALKKEENSKEESLASSGFYEYIGPDGYMYRVEYKADANGFRPKARRIETKYSGKWVLEATN